MCHNYAIKIELKMWCNMNFYDDIALAIVKVKSNDLKFNCNNISKSIDKAINIKCKTIFFAQGALTGVEHNYMFNTKSYIKAIEKHTLELINSIDGDISVGIHTIISLDKNYNVYIIFKNKTIVHIVNLDDSSTIEYQGISSSDVFKINDVNYSVKESIKADVFLNIKPCAYTRGFYQKQLDKYQDYKNMLSPAITGLDGASNIYASFAYIKHDNNLISSYKIGSFKDNDILTATSQESPRADDNDELLSILGLGLYDFMFKTHQKGFALSLSGGSDSALCASAVKAMVMNAIEDLGVQSFILKLNQLGFNFEYNNEPIMDFITNNIMPKMLTCVYQASEVSGSVTQKAAEDLANELGAKFYIWSIKDAVNTYVKMVNETCHVQLNWQDNDLVLQNIQARSRLPGIWMIANLEQKLLICTSNLSEATVGYCTMDGDTAGGLAPIGSLSKSYILKLNRHIAQNGITTKSLHTSVGSMFQVVDQAPTAELRPGGEQTDEKDLMPYELLDKIRALFILDRQDPIEIFTTLKEQSFLNLKDQELKSYINKFFRLLAQSQWKRQRSAVSFHLQDDDLSIGEFNFPILGSSITDILGMSDFFNEK